MIRQHIQPLIYGLSCLLIVFGIVSGGVPATAQDSPQPVALEVIAQINAYRVEQGKNPLVPNARLEALARDQVRYVLSLPELPEEGDIHLDAQGRTPREQAVLPPYHWETYGSNAQIAIGENAAVGSLGYAMNFWKNSSIHNQAMLNPIYREIGVWAEPNRTGYLFMVAFGARPNELPVVVDPLDSRLYIPNEYYTRGTGDWLRQVQTIRLFDAAGAPLTSAIPWQDTLSIPEHPGDRLSVMFDDGQRQLVSVVDLQRDIVILPDTLALVEGLTVSNTAVALEISPTQPVVTLPPVPTLLPAQPSAIPTLEQAIAQPSAIPTLTPALSQPTAIPTLTPGAPTATPAPSATPAVWDLVVLYDSRSLTLMNATDVRLDLSQVALSGGGITLAATRWTKVAPVELDRFPPHSCMQVSSWSDASDPPVPSACAYLLSYITVAPTDLFWTSTDFTLYQGSTPLATCGAGAGICTGALAR